jgi:uncharacterized membrane protein
VSRAFTGIVAALALATVVGMVVLWPGTPRQQIGAGLTVDTYDAHVVGVRESICPSLGLQRCDRATIRLEEGPDAGKLKVIQLDRTGLDPDVDAGDDIEVTNAPNGPMSTSGYVFQDFQRGRPLIELTLLFVAIVVLFGRLRGALSLVGLAVSLAVVLVFIVPAILDGKPPLPVAIVGSMAVALVTIPLAHGRGPKTLSALLGTAGSLLLTALLALAFTHAAHLTGLSSEEATFLESAGAQLSLEGLLLAGMVIGALGVLDDVTVSQASTVLALRDANPGLRFRGLFTLAMRVGRDHVSATVNTLVLAYVGASLPVLLVFHAAGVGIGDALGIEVVATQVVGMLVGSIGLIAAVPLTTALATRLALSEAEPILAGRDGRSRPER